MPNDRSDALNRIVQSAKRTPEFAQASKMGEIGNQYREIINYQRQRDLPKNTLTEFFSLDHDAATASKLATNYLDAYSKIQTLQDADKLKSNFDAYYEKIRPGIMSSAGTWFQNAFNIWSDPTDDYQKNNNRDNKYKTFTSLIAGAKQPLIGKAFTDSVPSISKSEVGKLHEINSSLLNMDEDAGPDKIHPFKQKILDFAVDNVLPGTSEYDPEFAAYVKQGDKFSVDDRDQYDVAAQRKKKEAVDKGLDALAAYYNKRLQDKQIDPKLREELERGLNIIGEKRGSNQNFWGDSFTPTKFQRAAWNLKNGIGSTVASLANTVTPGNYFERSASSFAMEDLYNSIPLDVNSDGKVDNVDVDKHGNPVYSSTFSWQDKNGNWRYNWGSVPEVSAKQIGQMAPIIALSTLTDGLVGGTALFKAMNAYKGLRLADRVLTTVTVAASVHDSMVHEERKYTKDKKLAESRGWYRAFIEGLTEGVGAPEFGITRATRFASTINEDVFRALIPGKISNTLNSFIRKTAPFAGRVVGQALSETLEEEMALFGDYYLTKAIKASDKNYAKVDELDADAIFKTFVDSFVTMLPYTVGTVGTSAVNGRFSEEMQNIASWNVANNPDIYRSKIKALEQKGELTKEQAQQAAAKINILEGSLNSMEKISNIRDLKTLLPDKDAQQQFFIAALKKQQLLAQDTTELSPEEREKVEKQLDEADVTLYKNQKRADKYANLSKEERENIIKNVFVNEEKAIRESQDPAFVTAKSLVYKRQLDFLKNSNKGREIELQGRERLIQATEEKLGELVQPDENGINKYTQSLLDENVDELTPIQILERVQSLGGRRTFVDETSQKELLDKYNQRVYAWLNEFNAKDEQGKIDDLAQVLRKTANSVHMFEPKALREDLSMSKGKVSFVPEFTDEQFEKAKEIALGQRVEDKKETPVEAPVETPVTETATATPTATQTPVTPTQTPTATPQAQTPGAPVEEAPELKVTAKPLTTDELEILDMFFDVPFADRNILKAAERLKEIVLARHPNIFSQKAFVAVIRGKFFTYLRENPDKIKRIPEGLFKAFSFIVANIETRSTNDLRNFVKKLEETLPGEQDTYDFVRLLFWTVYKGYHEKFKEADAAESETSELSTEEAKSAVAGFDPVAPPVWDAPSEDEVKELKQTEEETKRQQHALAVKLSPLKTRAFEVNGEDVETQDPVLVRQTEILKRLLSDYTGYSAQMMSYGEFAKEVLGADFDKVVEIINNPDRTIEDVSFITDKGIFDEGLINYWFNNGIEKAFKDPIITVVEDGEIAMFAVDGKEYPFYQNPHDLKEPATSKLSPNEKSIYEAGKEDLDRDFEDKKKLLDKSVKAIKADPTTKIVTPIDGVTMGVYFGGTTKLLGATKLEFTSDQVTVKRDGSKIGRYNPVGYNGQAWLVIDDEPYMLLNTFPEDDERAAIAELVFNPELRSEYFDDAEQLKTYIGNIFNIFLGNKKRKLFFAVDKDGETLNVFDRANGTTHPIKTKEELTKWFRDNNIRFNIAVRAIGKPISRFKMVGDTLTETQQSFTEYVKSTHTLYMTGDKPTDRKNLQLIISPSGLQGEQSEDEASADLAEDMKKEFELAAGFTVEKEVEVKPAEVPTLNKVANAELTEEEADWLYSNLRQITEKYDSTNLSNSIDPTLKTPLKFGDTTVTAIEPSAGGKSYIWFERPTGKWLISIEERKGKPFVHLLKINDKGTYYVEKLSVEELQQAIESSGLEKLVDSIYEDTNVEKPESRRDQFEVQNALQHKYGLKRTYKDIYNAFNKATTETKPAADKPFTFTDDGKVAVKPEGLKAIIPKQNKPTSLKEGVQQVKNLIGELVSQFADKITLPNVTREGVTFSNAKRGDFTLEAVIQRESIIDDLLNAVSAKAEKGKDAVEGGVLFDNVVELLNEAMKMPTFKQALTIGLYQSGSYLTPTEVSDLQEEFNKLALQSLQNYINFVEGATSMEVTVQASPVITQIVTEQEEQKAEETKEQCEIPSKGRNAPTKKQTKRR